MIDVEPTPDTTFAGFSPTALVLLARVRGQDSREWFAAHRREFDALVLEPLRTLVRDLADLMLDIDAGIEVRPAVGRTISRINRDTRFSRDKSRYRDHMWFTFKRPSANWQDAPSFFFEIAPSRYQYGMGYYAASRATMDALRSRIDHEPASFLAATELHRDEPRFSLEGERYVRPLPNPHGAEIQEWYQRKSFYLTCKREPDDVLFSDRLVGELESGFLMLAALYRELRSLAAH